MIIFLPVFSFNSHFVNLNQSLSLKKRSWWGFRVCAYICNLTVGEIGACLLAQKALERLCQCGQELRNIWCPNIWETALRDKVTSRRASHFCLLSQHDIFYEIKCKLPIDLTTFSSGSQRWEAAPSRRSNIQNRAMTQIANFLFRRSFSEPRGRFQRIPEAVIYCPILLFYVRVVRERGLS
jgi:hypothetical protein